MWVSILPVLWNESNEDHKTSLYNSSRERKETARTLFYIQKPPSKIVYKTKMKPRPEILYFTNLFYLPMYLWFQSLSDWSTKTWKSLEIFVFSTWQKFVINNCAWRFPADSRSCRTWRVLCLALTLFFRGRPTIMLQAEKAGHSVWPFCTAAVPG